MKHCNLYRLNFHIQDLDGCKQGNFSVTRHVNWDQVSSREDQSKFWNNKFCMMDTSCGGWRRNTHLAWLRLLTTALNTIHLVSNQLRAGWAETWVWHMWLPSLVSWIPGYSAKASKPYKQKSPVFRSLYNPFSKRDKKETNIWAQYTYSLF